MNISDVSSWLHRASASGKKTDEVHILVVGGVDEVAAGIEVSVKEFE
jgi:hypothetical protein